MNRFRRIQPSELIATGIAGIDLNNTIVTGQKIPFFADPDQPDNAVMDNVALRAKADEAMEAARKSSQEARLNASEAATAVKLAAKGTAERTAELLRLEQLAEELQARSEEMRARTRSSKYFGKGRMLRAYPKLRHGEKHRSLDELRERLKYERRH